MKRIAISFALCLAGICAAAQHQGDKYIGIGVAVDIQNMKSKDSSPYAKTYTEPATTTFAFQGEIGYFFADYFKLALGVGLPYLSTPTAKTADGKWLHNKTIGVQFNPSISRYARITDDFYYAPEIGGALEFGKVRQDQPSGEKESRGYYGWTLYFQFLSFEYRINSTVALGIGVGSLSHSYARVKEKEGDSFSQTSQTGFKFNDGSLALRFYF